MTNDPWKTGDFNDGYVSYIIRRSVGRRARRRRPTSRGSRYLTKTHRMRSLFRGLLPVTKLLRRFQMWHQKEMDLVYHGNHRGGIE